MIVNFFVVVPAMTQHRRAGAIDIATVRRLVPLAVVAVLVGVGVSELGVFAGPGEASLRLLFGVFLFLVAGYDLYRAARRNGKANKTTSTNPPRDDRPHRFGWSAAAMVSIPTGLVAGLLGVGGGILAVPLQRRFLRIPIRNAIANSATIIIATSLVGATAKNYAYYWDHDRALDAFRLAMILIPTAMIGSLIGSRLTHQLPLRVVKIAFFLLMLIAAARLTYKAVVAIPSRSDGSTVACATLALMTTSDPIPRHGTCSRAQLSRCSTPIPQTSPT